ncbi:hypothetical protein [Parasitella parasitica]|uniref:Uncharacterized protein n=1 Tax=Parasitella parasitica TaxID=35722 RepID=A0A0B7NJF2_9FUNG|nr:hypothetical protein [Parasitella parasitica]
MTKSKATTLLESRREPTLESKAIVDNRVLFHEKQKRSSVSYTVDWFDPFVLSKSNAFQITSSCRLPENCQEIIDKQPANPPRVVVNLKQEYIVLLTTAHIYLYSKKTNLLSTHAIPKSPHRENTIPLFNVFVHTDNNDKQVFKIITVDERGRAHLFVDGKDQQTEASFKVPLYRHYERTTAVKWINADQILIGSSTGQLYLLDVSSTAYQTTRLYKERISTVLDFVLASYHQILPQALDYTLPTIEETGPIVNISIDQDICYICSEHSVSLWKVETETRAELVAQICLQNDMIDCILPHVPSNVTKYTLECKIVNMVVKVKEQLVLLVSYTVPEISEFLQYAIIKFNIEYNSNGSVNMYAKHTVSLPYSELQSPRSKQPQLIITNDVAFVSFSDTVVARSLSKRSVFEESLVLKDKSDAILSVSTVETADNLASAMVVTANSDILEFQLERDTMVFKSRLEQALFFGVYKETPLRFPLVVEHNEDVGSAIMEVTNNILAEECPFLPKSLDSEISFIESRFYFQKHLYKILQDHMLDHLLSSEQKCRLFELLELYYLAKQIWRVVQEKSTDLEWISNAARISQTVVKTELGGKAQLEHLLRDHLYKIKEFLAQIATDQATICTDDIIPRIIQKCRSFEEKNVRRYGSCISPENHFSVLACEHLVDIFQQKVQQISSSACTAPCSDDEKRKLQDSASLLLDIYSKQPDVEKYAAVKETAFEGLRLVGSPEMAVDLANKYGDIPQIVASIPKLMLSPEEFKKQSESYIDRYGYPYFENLLREVDHEVAWYFCGLYPEFAETFFSNLGNLPKVAWKYHVKRQDYRKAYKVLLKCEDDMSKVEYDGAYPWIKMLSVLQEKSDAQ